MRMVFHNAFGKPMVHRSFEPSLSSTDPYQSTGGGTSAFALQSFSQSGVMACSGNHALARSKRGFSFHGGGDSKITDADIDTNDLGMGLGSRIGSLDLKRHQQVKLFLGLVIVQFGRANGRPIPNECHM